MSQSVFRHPADRVPTTIVVATTFVSFALFLWVDSPWILAGYYLLMLVPRGAFSAWNHHHQHVFTFRSTPANRLLEFCYGLHTGMTTHTWVLHHVFGHHLNFLDQTKDESRWTRDDGTQMGVFEYILTITVTAYPRAYEVGKRYPKHQRAFVRFATVTAVFLLAALIYRPIPALLVFILPMISALMWTAWATYDHHAGLPTDDQWHASYNIESRAYNLMSCNLGYHTAHHMRPGMHWSHLPELHASIRDKIPEELRMPWSIKRAPEADAEFGTSQPSPPAAE